MDVTRLALEEAEKFYATLGFGARTGFGRRPALLIIDCNHGWFAFVLDLDHPLLGELIHQVAMFHEAGANP